MKGHPIRVYVAAAVLALTAWGGARAEQVQFVTSGVFDSGDLAGTNTYRDATNGINITFIGSDNNTVTVPPASQATFGTFDSHLTTATSFVNVVSSFTLNIFETSPIFGGQLNFVGTLTGSLKIDNSQAFIDFGPSATGMIGNVVYTIVSADGGVLGRVNLAPPQTNGGLATISGLVSTVPEPSSMLLCALGVPALLGVATLRRKAA
jgi:hypothetical protein